jgi:hypothetical protein
MSPQNLKIIAYLRQGKDITPLNALVNFGVARLASRIEELRKIGFKINRTMKRINGKRYASYSLAG